MDIGWKIFLPITFGYLIFVASILVIFNGASFNLEIFPPIYSENNVFFIDEPSHLDNVMITHIPDSSLRIHSYFNGTTLAAVQVMF